MNNFSAIGRVGKDAETRFTPAGKSVTSWSLAVDSGYGDAKQTLWLDCSLWGERGQKVGEYIKKGSQLGVTGELGTRDHDGKTYLKLRVDNVTLVGSKQSEQSPRQERPARGAQSAPSEHGGALDSEEIPFAPRGKRNHWE